ncbi:hypothetical protein CCP3SC15_510013 [Gammaproteobacteria bacterium]
MKAKKFFIIFDDLLLLNTHSTTSLVVTVHTPSPSEGGCEYLSHILGITVLSRIKQ